MSKSTDNQSSLVKAVIELDELLAELDRLGGKITSADFKTEFDLEQTQKLMTRFAECGEAVSTNLLQLSRQLNEARVRAETVAQKVSERSAEIRSRRGEQQDAAEAFRQLAVKVERLNSSLREIAPTPGTDMSAQERAETQGRLIAVHRQIDELVEEAQVIQRDARESKMNAVERNADALAQTLRSMSQKLASLNLPRMN